MLSGCLIQDSLSSFSMASWTRDREVQADSSSATKMPRKPRWKPVASKLPHLRRWSRKNSHGDLLLRLACRLSRKIATNGLKSEEKSAINEQQRPTTHLCAPSVGGHLLLQLDSAAIFGRTGKDGLQDEDAPSSSTPKDYLNLTSLWYTFTWPRRSWYKWSNSTLVLKFIFQGGNSGISKLWTFWNRLYKVWSLTGHLFRSCVAQHNFTHSAVYVKLLQSLISFL